MSLIEGLRVKHEVILVTMTFSKKESELLKGIEKQGFFVRSIVAPNKSGFLKKIFYKVRNTLRAIFRGIPGEISYATPRVFLKLISDTARREKVDMVLSSYWHMYMLPDILREFKNVLITHDLDFLIHPVRIPGGRGVLRRLTAGHDAAMREKIEMKAYGCYDTILTVTHKDAEALRKEPVAEKKKIFPLPIALDLERFKRGNLQRKEDRVLIIGTFHSDFNRDALLYFLRDIFPEIIRRRPSTFLHVVGEGVDRDTRDNAGANVEFHGYVEDIVPVLGECSLMVLPLRFAGGVRIRMIEAAAVGTPVVSTSKGVEGMGLIDGKEYLEASSAKEMADLVIRLLEDMKMAEKIGENARRWVEENFSLESYPERLDDLLIKIRE